MSGTSMDGIDVALIDSDGASAVSFGPTGFEAYAEATRALLRTALSDAGGLAARLGSVTSAGSGVRVVNIGNGLGAA